MEYNFREIEKKWQKRWVEEKTYQVTEDESKQKFYVIKFIYFIVISLLLLTSNIQNKKKKVNRESVVI